MKALIEEIAFDLGKSDRGNKAASQRVRTNTIKFAKVAKLYRKESIAEKGKAAGGKKKAAGKKAGAAKKAAPKKAAPKKVAKKTKKAAPKKAAGKKR